MLQRPDTGAFVFGIILVALGAYILIVGNVPFYASLSWNLGPFDSGTALRMGGFGMVAVGLFLAWDASRAR